MSISGLLYRLNDVAITKRLYFIISVISLWILLGFSTLLFHLKDLSVTIALISLILGCVAGLLIFSVVKSLKDGIREIITGAGLIKKNQLKTRVDTCFKNEFGILCWTFNDLANQLEENINEVESLRISLDKERQRAEHYERAKQYFLVNMSHEIRTPMNAILGFARYLQDSLKDQEDLESVKMIIKSGEHLLATLNDILDFVNIETGDISFVCLPFNLKDTVHSIYILREPNAKLKQIGLKYSIDPTIPEAIYGDSARLAQILSGLTSNAIKFTERGGVYISARCISDHDDHVMIEFSVQDSGIGIDKDMQEKIFSPFVQGCGHMRRKFGGTGLGLSLVKHLIVLQDGSIELKSRTGEGSEFYFKLPFLKVHAGRKLIKSKNEAINLIAESEIGKGINVLIVEDNLINQLLVIKLLQKRGYQTTVAENGKVALRKYASSDFNIILMDLQMPDMDGYETTIHIRNMTSYKRDIPIVAMTAHTIKGEREKCLSIGMNDYISKPFHAEELYEKIRLLAPTVPVPAL